METRLRGLVLATLLCAALAPVRADWLNLTGAETAPNIAEITVHDDHVAIALEVFVGDLEVFEDLVPDAWLSDASGRPGPAERTARFAREVLPVTPAGGEPLPVEVVLVEPRRRVDRRSPFAGMIDPISRRRVPEPPADKRVLYAELRYPFEGHPAALTIAPPADAEGRVRASVGFIAYHKSVPVIDFRYLGAPATLLLDWDDPWYTRFEHPSLNRHHRSALMSFLYVEPYEVRHEVLVRVRDLQEWMDLGLRDPRYVDPDELEALEQRVGEFLLGRNRTLIDGRAVEPLLDRVELVEVGLRGVQVVQRPERVETSVAMLGAIVAYLTDGLPQEVSVDWDLFTDGAQRIPTVSTDPAGPLPGFVTPGDRVHRWQNFLKNHVTTEVRSVPADARYARFELPVVTVLCATALLAVALRRRPGRSVRTRAGAMVALAAIGLGALALPWGRVGIARPAALAPALADDEALAVLDALLTNVYRAFDFRDEAVVHDKLALTVAGDLLADVYLQSRRSLAVQRAGGAQAKITDVEVRSATATPVDDGSGGYVVRTTWTARGTVGHWGHTHVRENLYDAVLTLSPAEGRWRITGMEIVDEQRIDPAARQVG